ncbi:hypothetical protein ACF1HU_09790 [Streptomyces olivaceus]|uniref:hypothetical protein n=1 Tax=Streptomyces olivaceus TaxID=47716 RepID=UPI0036F72694
MDATATNGPLALVYGFIRTTESPGRSRPSFSQQYCCWAEGRPSWLIGGTQSAILFVVVQYCQRTLRFGT